MRGGVVDWRVAKDILCDTVINPFPLKRKVKSRLKFKTAFCSTIPFCDHGRATAGAGTSSGGHTDFALRTSSIC